MTKRMLLDASHPEETRVVVLSGNRLDEFDYETKDKKQLKGNIYLAKITRVEPSLQAAFVDYGGNRHGFLPFSEIHPDYYRLPVADREALIEEEEAAQRRQAEEDSEAGDAAANGDGGGDDADADAEAASSASKRRRSRRKGGNGADGDGDGEEDGDPEVEQVETAQSVETLAGDDIEDAARRRAASMGRYKIQEVIKRRQVILVQVVKEERGNKGAALTTYLSLAGRYCVLMPNTNKGGGISRKIASAQDRKRLKGVLSELHIPEGMAVIVRTAGSNRSKLEIKRDYEYLLRLWDQIRSTTLQSTAPSLIYEEANLIKRAVRDLYTRDMDEILVEGEDGYKAAKAFMKSLMPSHAKKVKKYDDARIPILHRFQVESQLDNIHNPTVQLKSGGYIVMNQTEALVAIDVNSGKATKERHIEETALKTNLEAAEEVARQLKLRDLAGLIVIDFIDMDAAKNNREVEQRLKEAMRHDRARIQLGRISPFGLLELSRQRLRPSLHETSTEVCRTCGGSGFVRSPDSTSLHVLRALEEEGIKRGGGEVQLTVPTGVALYVLNDKRERLVEVEQRYGFRVRIDTDDRLVPPAYRLDRLSTAPVSEDRQAEVTSETVEVPTDSELAEEMADDGEVREVETDARGGDDGEDKRRKRGRRGGRRKKQAEAEEGETQRDDQAAAQQAVAEAEAEDDQQAGESESRGDADGDGEGDSGQAKRRRRRGKRGGRRRSRRRDGQDDPIAESRDADSDRERDEDAAATSTSDAPGASESAEATPSTEDAAPAEAASEDAAASPEAESDAAPAKPKRARARKSKAAAAASEPADAAAAETAEPRDAASEDDGEAPAKPKRRSRRKADSGTASGGRRGKSAKTADTAAETPADTAAESGTDAGGATETPAEAGPDAAAEPEASETATPPTAPDGPESAPADSAPEEARETAFGEAAQPTGGDDVATSEKPRTRRKGWWQKLVN